MRLFLLSTFITIAASGAAGVPDPPREFRASWVATVYNIDWPSSPGLPAATQKAQLTKILEDAASWNLNAIVLQVRPAGDALYASDLEPWSSVLTGSEGRSPGYDPLAFAIAGAHARGIELHAWFNPFRPAVGAGKRHPENHVIRKRPSAVRTYRGKPWLDPGDPWVRDYTLEVVTDVVRRYDIDAVHIDDYFYPYPPVGEKCDFPDDATYGKSGGGQDRDAWRRSNTDRFVSSLYTAVKRLKPWVKVGVSPFGIWRPGHPQGTEAKLDSYAHIYADSRRWFREGWCDYLSPQLYWRIEPRAQSFTGLLGWWADENRKRRHLWPGIATSRVDSSEDPGRPASEIANQLDATRLVTRGHLHWSHSALAQDRGGIHKVLGPRYATKALVPASPWLGKAELSRPELRWSGDNRVTWTPDTSARSTAIQVLHGGRWQLVATTPPNVVTQTLRGAPEAVAVRHIDRFGNAGPAAVLEK